MKKVLIVLAVIISVGAKAQSFGSMASLSTGVDGISGYGYNGWVSGKKFGVEYSYAASSSTLKNPDSDFSYYISNSFGVTYILKSQLENTHVILGGGVQSVYSETFGTKTVTGVVPGFTTNVPGQSSTKSHYYSYQVPNNRWQRDVMPYFSVAVEHNVNSIFNVRARVEGGSVIMAGVGLGIRISNL
jgi:hypothetical protein